MTLVLRSDPISISGGPRTLLKWGVYDSLGHANGRGWAKQITQRLMRGFNPLAFQWYMV